MRALLGVSRAIDGLTSFIGKSVIWLVLAAVLISAGNAIVRKLFQTSSNAFLEIQWYLFAAVFLLGAGYTFLHNAHVRIDFISHKLSAKARNIIDIAGIVLVLIPFSWLVIDLAWPFFANAYQSGEMSENAGGLIRWPVYLLLPAGMALLLLQAVSELIKRIAFLTGHGPDALAHQETGHGESTHMDEMIDVAPHGGRD
jgi:TRAP-type mannitol/chloroaromatic compound transport system permease small subunit